MPLVVARRVIGGVESIAFLPPPVANSGELCRLEAENRCGATGIGSDSVHFVANGAASCA